MARPRGKSEGQLPADERHLALDPVHPLGQSGNIGLEPGEKANLHRDDDAGRRKDGPPSLHVPSLACLLPQTKHFVSERQEETADARPPLPDCDPEVGFP